MNRLSVVQGWIMVGLIAFGVFFITIDIISPIFKFTIGYTAVAMGALLMFLEFGTRVWYWWVPLGLGDRYVVNKTLYNNNYEEIESWARKNLGDSIRNYQNYNKFYFLQKTDAMAFKLRWEK